MADSQPQSNATVLKPWALHLQKLGLELKCSFCFNLYTKPLLLPCDHIFCSSCVPKSGLFGYECPLCNLPYVEKELRQAPYMENLVNIFRCLDASFSPHVLDSGNSVKGTVPPLPPGNSDSVEKDYSFAVSRFRNGSQRQDFQTFERNTNSLLSPAADLQQEKYKAVDSDTNQPVVAPDSPSGAAKVISNDGCHAGSHGDNAENGSVKNCSKRKVDDLKAEGLGDCRVLHVKKRKQLNRGPPQIHEGHSPPLSADLQYLASSDSNMNHKRRSSCSDQIAVESDLISLANFICEFCKTWKITEITGPMQHFADGKQVFGSDAGCSNVRHVHKTCIEWAPQIFFESDTVVKNLDKELARAAKLKCDSCGLKGAALGCYKKSCRRSYHVPCAHDVEESRWSADDYLILCPSHASHKFPSEKSRKSAVKKCMTSVQIYDEQRNSHESDFWAPSPATDWVLCGSALSAQEKLLLVKFAKMCGSIVTKAWNPNVTHVIAGTDGNGACCRTLKVLMAILKGRWILRTDWIKACMQSKRPVDEERYEISLDNHGFCKGPKTGRLRALSNGPQLFDGLRFFFSSEFLPTLKHDIQDLIIAGGGTIVASREQLKEFSDACSDPSMLLIVYNSDANMGRIDAREALQRQVEAERLANEIGSQAVAHTWVLDLIASGSMQPMNKYRTE